jgi:hypothetical protein
VGPLPTHSVWFGSDSTASCKIRCSPLALAKLATTALPTSLPGGGRACHEGGPEAVLRHGAA